MWRSCFALINNLSRTRRKLHCLKSTLGITIDVKLCITCTALHRSLLTKGSETPVSGNQTIPGGAGFSITGLQCFLLALQNTTVMTKLNMALSPTFAIKIPADRPRGTWPTLCCLPSPISVFGLASDLQDSDGYKAREAGPVWLLSPILFSSLPFYLFSPSLTQCLPGVLG